MNVTVTGATGFIGRQLLAALAARNCSLRALSRRGRAGLPADVRVSVWDPAGGEPPSESVQDADVVVHLAGEPVAQRWTAEAKSRIRASRIEGTRNLVRALARLKRRPAALVCASAIGYYGDCGDELLTEDSPPGDDFLASLCVAWESEALAAEALGLRVARVRIGIVLEPHGGTLARMLPPFRLGLGGRIGSGKQWMSWIHAHDLVNLICHAVESPIAGPLNATAPTPATNSEFTRALGRALHRPAIFPLPPLFLRAVFGEMAEILFASQRVAPARAQAEGFRFEFPQLGPALEDLLRPGNPGKQADV